MYYSRRARREETKTKKTKVFHAVGFFDLMLLCRQKYFPFEARAIFDPINEWDRPNHVCNQVMEGLWNELDMGEWDAFLKEYPLPSNPYNSF